ncbi:hypothetical protein BD413DRAFT_551393 [Trametes elegans]|nr:hypothetical protein BD413DRAFT_551393 [Trametes elegans]
MSTRTTSKSCPYNGCGYASTSTSASACDHNVGSHVSNLHGEKTAVWWGATQTTILRDLATKEMVCPCGKFRSKNASLVRKHASIQHKGSGKTTTAATSSVQQSGRALPSTPAVSSATASRAPTEQLSASKREAKSVPMLRRSTSSRSVLDAVVIPPHPAVKKSSMASPSTVPVKRARVSFSIDSSKDTLPAKFRRKAEKEFSTTKAVKDQNSTMPQVTAQLSGTSKDPVGSSPKSRSPNKERPISAWRTELSQHTKNSASSSTKKSAPLLQGPMAVHLPVISTQVAQTSSPRADASAKRAPQQPNPQPSLSASPLTSSARKSIEALEKEKRRKSKDEAEKFTVAQTFAADRQSPTTVPGSTSTFSVLPHADPPIPAPLRIPSPLRVPSPQHIPTVSSSSKPSPTLHSSDHSHRTSTAHTKVHVTEPHRLVQSHTRSARTDNVQAAGAASSTTVSGSSVHVTLDVPVRHAQPTPAMQPKPKPKPRPIPPPPKLSAAQSIAQNVNDVSKSGAVQYEKPAEVPTTDQCGLKRPAESALDERRAKWPALSSSSHHCAPPQPQPDIDSDVPSQLSASQPPEDGQKPRKRRRVTKQMRAREFRPWFDRFLKEYRAKKAVGDASVVDRTKYEHVARLRAAGGTAYTTPEEFYAAVGQCLRALRRARMHGNQKEPGKRDSVRGEIVREELRDIGLSLDKDTEGRIEVSSGWGYGMSERWWHYPCTCGGQPRKSSHSRESSTGEKHSDWCHGRIVLKVGCDNALDAYRIGGQYISLEVVH